MLVGVMEKTPENPEESSQRNSLLYYRTYLITPLVANTKLLTEVTRTSQEF